MLELLSPAGSPEAVIAAVQNGADAVYLGFADMTGCRRAVNFMDEAFEASVRYCRVRGCKVYLALNIAVTDEETQKAAGLALRAQRAGADAVIVRDFGLFRVLRALLPEMPLFADAQMGFYTPEGAQAAAQLGFARLFLPPDLSLEAAERITRLAGIETGYLAQGELCPSLTGLCFMSSLTGRGSAARGLCAGMCREKYSLGGRWDTRPLSFKDRCLVQSLADIEAAGIRCVQIGGGENSPEYTAAFTALYSRALHQGIRPAPSELESLEKAFSRYGFSGAAAEPAGEPTVPGREAEKLGSALRKAYAAAETRRVPVDFAVVARAGAQGIRVGVQDDDGHRAVLDGPAPAPAGDLPLTEEGLIEVLYRTAGTPYRCRAVRVAAHGGLFGSADAFDALRRNLLEKLTEERAAAPNRKELSFPALPLSGSERREPAFIFSFLTPEQMTADMAVLRPACVYAPLELLVSRPELAEPFLLKSCSVVAELPPITGEEEEEALRALLDKARAQGIYEVLCGNLGLSLLARQRGMQLRGDLALGAYNGFSLQNLAAAGFLSATVSYELTLEQIRALPKPLDTEMVVYGRLPAMTVASCLLKESAGRCVCATPGQLTDEHGGVWPVTRQFGCRNTIYASRKLFLGDRSGDLAGLGLWGLRLSFTTESARECLEIARSYTADSGYRPNGLMRGYYYRGVQ